MARSEWTLKSHEVTVHDQAGPGANSTTVTHSGVGRWEAFSSWPRVQLGTLQVGVEGGWGAGTVGENTPLLSDLLMSCESLAVA